MKVKLLLVLLVFFLNVFPGLCFCGNKEICIRSGEMVALHCPPFRAQNQSTAELIWTSYTEQKTNVISNMSSAELRRIGVLLHERSLVILSADLNSQGNYSCSSRNAISHFWFTLRVYTSQSTMYGKTCYTEESCTLHCPVANIPDENTPNMTSNGTTWYKKGGSPVSNYFPSVKENDKGDYICARSYLYNQQIYNMTFTVSLDVQPNKRVQESAKIHSPRDGDVFYVDLGSTVEISCKAVTCAEFDTLSWWIGDSLANTTVCAREDIVVTLVIKRVTKEDLYRNYTCKLESDNQDSSSINITLAMKAGPSYVSLAVCIVCVLVVMMITTTVYFKFKIHITLFLRDTLGCHRSTSGGKSYDAFLMFYKSDTDTGLNEDDQEWLKTVLEEKLGYNLCLYDRDIPPGKAVAEAVLDSVEQSQTVVLVPTSSDPGLGSGVLSAIHTALVERKTCLVLITTVSKEVSQSDSVPKVLQLLSDIGHCVPWRGKHSMAPSSSFWKQLRYHLPAPQHAPKMKLLPQTVKV